MIAEPIVEANQFPIGRRRIRGRERWCAWIVGLPFDKHFVADGRRLGGRRRKVWRRRRIGGAVHRVEPPESGRIGRVEIGVKCESLEPLLARRVGQRDAGIVADVEVLDDGTARRIHRVKRPALIVHEQPPGGIPRRHAHPRHVVGVRIRQPRHVANADLQRADRNRRGKRLGRGQAGRQVHRDDRQDDILHGNLREISRASEHTIRAERLAAEGICRFRHSMAGTGGSAASEWRRFEHGPKQRGPASPGTKDSFSASPCPFSQGTAKGCNYRTADPRDDAVVAASNRKSASIAATSHSTHRGGEPRRVLVDRASAHIGRPTLNAARAAHDPRPQRTATKRRPGGRTPPRVESNCPVSARLCCGSRYNGPPASPSSPLTQEIAVAKKAAKKSAKKSSKKLDVTKKDVGGLSGAVMGALVAGPVGALAGGVAGASSAKRPKRANSR